MSAHAYPRSLFDVRSYLNAGDVASARNIVVNQPHRWKNCLTAEEIQALRAGGTPEEALDGPQPPPRQPDPRRC